MSSSHRIPKCDLLEHMEEGRCCLAEVSEDSGSSMASFKHPTNGL